jgi:outer membrane protein assembly factor BamB
VAPYISESAVFDATGNLYIGGFQKTFKINAETGQTIWETTTVPMASGSGELAVNTSNNTGYTLEQSGGISYLWATDLTNGVKKYSKIVNDLQPGGNVPQSALMVGQNQIVYVQLTEDNIAAFSDDGSQFNLLWQTTIIGNSAFSLMCVDNDDAVYAPTGGRLVRLDGLTGDTLALSAYIGEGGLFTPRISASNNNFIYATTGEDSVFAFDKSLNKIWSAYLPNSNTSGVSLAPNGLAVVAGANIIRVYTPKTFTSRLEFDQSAIILYPNPTADYCIIKADQRAMGKRYRLVGVTGQTILAGILRNGTQYLDLSAVPSGTYYLTIDGQSRSYAVIKQ